jgi:YggT family protein
MSSNIDQAGLFLINIVFWLFIFAVMLRFILQWVRADFYNPISQVVVKVTNPLLIPLRRVIPGFRGWDVAALVLMLLAELANVYLIVWLFLGSLPDFGTALYWSILRLIIVLVDLYFFSILIQVLLSWINPGTYSPVASVLWSINEPLLRPFRRAIPPLGGLDFSPLVVMILLQVIDILIPLPNFIR